MKGDRRGPAAALCAMLVVFFLLGGAAIGRCRMADNRKDDGMTADSEVISPARTAGQKNAAVQSVRAADAQSLGSSDPVEITSEVRRALAGTSFEAKVTSARVSSVSLVFTYTFEYNDILYEAGETYYDSEIGSEEGFLAYFAEHYGSITDTDGTELTFEDLSVNDTILVTLDADGDVESIVITGSESAGLLRLLAEGMLMPVVLLAAVCLIGRFRAPEPGRKVPLGRIAAIFLTGMLIVLPVAYIESWFDAFLSTTLGTGSILYLAAYAFLCIAVAEELSKYLVLVLLSWRSRWFTQSYDGVIFAVASSMGFSALENVFYLMTFGAGMDMFLARSLWASPGHCAHAVIMGAFYGRAKAASERGDREACRYNLVLSIAVPILTHGLYDLFCDEALLPLFGLSQVWIQKVIAIVWDVIAVLLLLYCRRRNELFRSEGEEHRDYSPGNENSSSRSEDAQIRMNPPREEDEALADAGHGNADGTFCPACGTRLPAGALFCGNCGTRLPKMQPSAGGGAAQEMCEGPDGFDADAGSVRGGRFF